MFCRRAVSANRIEPRSAWLPCGAVQADESTTPTPPEATPAGAAVGVERLDANVPAPPSEHAAWLLAVALGLVGIAVLVSTLLGAGSASTPRSLPPAVLDVAATPPPSASRSTAAFG